MGPKDYKLDGEKVDGIFAPFWACLKEDTDGSWDQKFKQFTTKSGGICEKQILTNAKSIAKQSELMLKSAGSSTKERKTKKIQSTFDSESRLRKHKKSDTTNKLIVNPAFYSQYTRFSFDE